MLENTENEEFVKLTNSIDDIQSNDDQYFISQNEKENISENIINNNSINQSQKKNFNYNMSQVRESISKAINLRQSLFKSKEEKKNEDENNIRNSQKDISISYSNNKMNLTSNKANDNIINEILFDYTGSAKLDLSKFNNNNQDIINSESNQEYYLNSMSSNINDNNDDNKDNNDIIYHENNDIIYNENNNININDLMNKKTHFNYDIDLEKQDNNNTQENYNYNDNENNNDIGNNKENKDTITIEENNNMFKGNNNIMNNQENNDSNKDTNIIINYNKNYSFGNKDINDNINENTNDNQSGHFNIDMVNINQKEEKEENKEEEIPKIQIINNNYENNNENMNMNMKMNDDNKLIGNRENYFFNYRSDVLFNRINMLDTKFEQKNYDINISFNPPSTKMENPPEENKNTKIYKIDMQNDYLYNIKDNKINEDKITNTNNNNNTYGEINMNTNTNTNFFDSKTSFNSIDTFKINKVNGEEKEIQNQLKLEEEKLKELEEQKSKLIEEEKERKQKIKEEITKNEIKKMEMHRIYKEVQKQKMIGEEKLNKIKIEQEKKREEIQELLRQSKKDEEKLKSIADLNRNSYNIAKSNLSIYDYHDNGVKNYYMDYLKEIQMRNEAINKNSLEIAKNKISQINISDSNNSTNIMKVKSKNFFNKTKEICNFKKIKKENYSCTDLNNINLFNNHLNNEDKMNNYTNAYNDINTSFKNEFNLNNINEDDLNSSKFNLNSYFKINIKNKNANNKKYDLKSFYNNNSYKESKYLSKDIKEYNISGKKSVISLTPNGLYRLKNEEENNYNFGNNSFYINKKYNHGTEIETNREDVIIKSLSKNKIRNSMTQTRFYRTRLDPDQLTSNYAKEKVKALLNNERNYSYDYNINTYKNKNNKNLYNNTSHSISNLDYLAKKRNIYNDYLNSFNNNTYLKNNIYNEIVNNNNLYNNNNFYNNNQINIASENINNINNYNNQRKVTKKLNTYRTTCNLKKGNSYCKMQQSQQINNKKNKNNENTTKMMTNFNFNHGKCFSDLRNYRISSPLTEKINYNNISINSIKVNHNNKKRNKQKLCDKCIRRRIFKESSSHYEKDKNYMKRSDSFFRNNTLKLYPGFQSNCIN